VPSRLLKSKECVTSARTDYLKAGMSTGKPPDDSTAMNVHGTLPRSWITVAMLLLNLVVWLNAAISLVH
jgi:hypothetical protein